jgi:glucose-1-phosphate adenylyltransferase
MLFKIQVGERASMAYKVLVIDQKPLLKIINQAITEKRTSPNIFEMVINIVLNSGVKTGTLKARYWPIKNVPEYYNLHWDVIFNPQIFNLLFEEKIIQSKIDASGYASIGAGGTVSGSFISDHCVIDGTVSNSIIYPGVEIARGAVVKDSIILPFVKIGPGVKIYRSIFDERTDHEPENASYTIEGDCKVGSENQAVKNSDYPESLFAGITLIGKDCRIGNDARIGGGCYVASGLGADYFAQKKFLYDGMSVVK